MALEKTEYPGYFRDSKTGVIINTNESELNSYRKQVDQELKLQGLENKIDKLEGMLERLLTREAGNSDV